MPAGWYQMRATAVFFLAAILGASLGYFGVSQWLGKKGSTATSAPIATPSPVDIVVVSEEDALRQRADNYQSVTTITDALRLPTLFAQTEALIALAARSDSEAVSRLMTEAARTIDSAPARQQLLMVLLARFVELDPALALQQLLQTGLAARQPQLLSVLFSSWAATDLNAAISAVHTLQSQEQIQTAGNAILAAHRQHGKELADNILARLPRKYNLTRYEIQTLAQQASRDPERAMIAAERIQDPQQRYASMHKIMQKWVQQDVQGAATRLLDMEKSEIKQSLAHLVVQKLAEQDAEAAIDWVTGNTHGAERSSMLYAAIMQIANSDPERAISYLDRLPASQRDSVAMSVAMSWAGSDPEAAVTWVSEQNLKPEVGTLSMLAEIWTVNDPQAAARYLENLPARDRGDWLAGVAQGYARNDPAAALKWLQQHKSEPGYTDALDNALAEWSTREPRAVLAFVERQPERAGMTNAVVNAVANLAQDDVNAALAAIDALPEGDLQQTAVAVLADNWSMDDPQGLSDWIAAQSPGPSRDRAIQAQITHLGNQPERAIDLINSLQSDEARVNSMMQLLYMSGADENKAIEMLEQLDVPEAERESLVSMLRQPRQPHRDSPMRIPFALERR